MIVFSKATVAKSSALLVTSGMLWASAVTAIHASAVKIGRLLRRHVPSVGFTHAAQMMVLNGASRKPPKELNCVSQPRLLLAFHRFIFGSLSASCFDFRLRRSAYAPSSSHEFQIADFDEVDRTELLSR